MDVLCLLHDGDEYGLVRWPLSEIVQATGISSREARELVTKGVLKGADKGFEGFAYTPSHANQQGEPVQLIAPSDGPCWFSSRMVVDEWRRLRRGHQTRFTTDNQPAEKEGTDAANKNSPKPQPKPTPKPSPKPPIGDGSGDGPSSSSSSSGSSTVGDKSPTGAAGANGGSAQQAEKPAWWPELDRYGRVTSEVTEKIIFDTGKVILGGNAGGLIARARKAYRHKDQFVLEILLQAEEKSDAKEWFSAVVKNAERDELKNAPSEIYPQREYRA